MKTILSRIIFSIVSIAIAIGFWSCEDKIDYPNGYYEEGLSTIDVDLEFKEFTLALGDSRSTGNATKSIRDLWFVFYDGEQKFIEKRKITADSIKIVDNERPDGAPSSEAQTGHAVVKLTIPNGHYYIYAVANHDLSTADVSTVEKLYALPLTWNETYSDEPGWQSPNSQMLGGFKPLAKKDNKDSKAEKVTISSNGTKIHAWLTRAASKVTVAFDTQNLRDDVRIYLKSIQIKDIPKYCPLGYDNSPGQDNMESYKHNQLTDVQRKELINVGETIYFGTAKENDDPKTQHSGWRIIASGDSIYGLYSEKNRDKIDRNIPVEQRWAREHSELAPALYFYENRQPDGDVLNAPWTDKRQDVTGANKQVSYPDGTDPKDKAWKDGMPFGTYIEVKGYYENEGKARPGKGEIIYRFMLGKDEIKNYDSERNHHYRLTMKFNGYANDVDFHIDYREESKPGLHVQDTTYVSYLYNQECHTTVRATPREGYDLLSLESYIVDNEWRPDGIAAGEESNMYHTNAWNYQQNFTKDKGYEEAIGGYTRPNLSVTWTDFNGKKNTFTAANNIEFGYLALRKTRTNIYELGGGGNNKATFVAKARKLFFASDPESGNAGGNSYKKGESKGYRDYGNMPTSDGIKRGGDDTDGRFEITRRTDKLNKSVDYIMEVPVYTRARSIDSYAVYSGANPFYTHRRYARVVFVATYKKVNSTIPGPETYQEIGQTHVLQAYRIDNPRGIYRRRTNLEPFKVVLLYSKKTAAQLIEDNISDTEEIYDEIISRGGWTVTIENDPNKMVQIQANGQTITGSGSITGRNNTPIVFTYKPVKTPPVGECYGATIFVTYHNNSCTHRIVVRQGYDAHAIGPNQTAKWSAFNVYNNTTLTKSPLSIGSTFRHVDLSQPIREDNNTRKGYGYLQTPPGALWLLAGAGNNAVKDEVSGNSGLAWDDLKSMTGMSVGLGTVKWKLTLPIHDKSYTYRLPDYTELPDIGIYSNKDSPDQIKADEAKVLKIGHAVGICYADGAKGVLKTKRAYSYSDPDNVGADSEMGVNGVIVFSEENADNVFFPFGSLGHPRRRNNGMLEYGSVDFLLNREADRFRPMAMLLKYQIGAAYWQTGVTATSRLAIDFNGGNYMCSYLNSADVFQTGADSKGLNGNSDALPIKPICTETQTPPADDNQTTRSRR